MAFLLERFDIIKQHHDKTGLYMYHDTVGATTDPSSKVAGSLIAAIVADNFFNSVADTLQVPGGLIYVTATDGAGIYKVTQVYNGTTGAAEVKIAYAGSDLAGITASVTEINLLDGVTATTAELNTVTGVTATAAEINKACDLSAQIQTLTASGAVNAAVQAVFLNHATVAIASTIATAVTHQGLFLIKAGLEPAVGQDHTCTITTGNWNGTNKVATFADINDSLLVYFDAAGNGTVLVNTGSVAFSG
jgi:hypothetical protein